MAIPGWFTQVMDLFPELSRGRGGGVEKKSSSASSSYAWQYFTIKTISLTSKCCHVKKKLKVSIKLNLSKAKSQSDSCHFWHLTCKQRQIRWGQGWSTAIKTSCRPENTCKLKSRFTWLQLCITLLSRIVRVVTAMTLP